MTPSEARRTALFHARSEDCAPFTEDDLIGKGHFRLSTWRSHFAEDLRRASPGRVRSAEERQRIEAFLTSEGSEP